MVKRRGEERTKVCANRAIVLIKKASLGRSLKWNNESKTFLQNEYSVRYTLML